MSRLYQICSRCIMDTSDPLIEFDQDGVCNHCKNYLKKVALHLPALKERKKKLDQLLEEIKTQGQGKKYDCLTGVSGGVDSTYLTYMIHKLGLRCLVVHLDNGWNSELAVHNIHQIIKHTGFDLYTKVLNWEEFKRLQVAYLKASVLDLEAITDHAIFATLFKTAAAQQIPYILNGANIVTEGILPLSWRYDQKLTDAVNIKAIFRQFDGGHLEDYPLMSIQKYAYYQKIKKIKNIDLLNYLPYVKEEAKEIIQRELGWRDYGGKHYESVITRFYQGYILPEKFHIDKRRAHFATLVAGKQMSRDEALKKMEEPIMSATLLKEDLEYVPKKLGLSPLQFEAIMDLPPKQHEDYPTNSSLRQWLFKMNKKLLRA